MENMTALSREMFENAVHITNTADAARILLDYKQYRTLGDVLQAFSDCSDLRGTLVEGLLRWNPNDVKASIDRKVRNWLGGKTQSINKEDAFMLSRIFALPLDRTNEFLKLTTGEGIHWRDPEDIVWCYAIAQQLQPPEIRRLLNRVQDLRKASAANTSMVPGSYTAEVYEKLQPVLYGSEEELFAFLEEEQARLGVFHNTAYQLFVRSMHLLEQGFSDHDVEALFREMTQGEKRKKEADAADRRETARREAASAGHLIDFDDPDRRKTLADTDGDTELYQPENLTSREVLETYLYRSLVPAKERSSAAKSDPFFAIRRSIRQSWPDEFTLSRMKNRQIDVSRKVLILLFLATDGSNTDFAEMDEDEEFYTQDDVFQDVYTRLNLMLTSCGFLKLDPRSAFDWMILFCISAGDLWESDERLQAMLMEMFPEEGA